MRRGSIRRVLILLWVGILLAWGLSACGERSVESQLQGPGYSAEFETLRSSSNSDFLVGVLEDDELTESEVAEARSRFVECVAESGRLEATDLADGGFEYTGPAIDKGDYQIVIDACNKRTSADVITMLARRIRDNPENIESNALIAFCLVKKGVVDPAYGAEQYSADMERYFALPESQRRGSLMFPQFIDEERGPVAHDECIEMSANEILKLAN